MYNLTATEIIEIMDTLEMVESTKGLKDINDTINSIFIKAYSIDWAENKALVRFASNVINCMDLVETQKGYYKLISK